MAEKLSVINDRNGLRTQFIELMNEVERDNLENVVIIFERKDGGITHFHRGNEVKLLGLLELVKITMAREEFPTTDIVEWED